MYVSYYFFCELCGSGNLKAAAAIYGHLNIEGLNVFDLRALRADGQHWDFSLLSHRRECRQRLQEQDPDWLIGAPPCSPFSRLNWNTNFKKMNEHDVQRYVAVGRLHVSFAVQCYRDQLRRGKFFLHEHPAAAESWKEGNMKKLLQLPCVASVVSDQCMFNSLTVDSDGNQGLARKPTRFVSNSRYMIEEPT